MKFLQTKIPQKCLKYGEKSCDLDHQRIIMLIKCNQTWDICKILFQTSVWEISKIRKIHQKNSVEKDDIRLVIPNWVQLYQKAKNKTKVVCGTTHRHHTISHTKTMPTNHGTVSNTGMSHALTSLTPQTMKVRDTSWGKQHGRGAWETWPLHFWHRHVTALTTSHTNHMEYFAMFSHFANILSLKFTELPCSSMHTHLSWPSCPEKCYLMILISFPWERLPNNCGNTPVTSPLKRCYLMTPISFPIKSSAKQLWEHPYHKPPKKMLSNDAHIIFHVTWPK